MTKPIELYDQWLRAEFIHLNTLLEAAYCRAGREILHDLPELEQVKNTLLRSGARLIERIADAAEIPPDPHARYILLGMVGYFLAACRRHEISPTDATGDKILSAAWNISNRIGSSLGVAPRYVFAHQALYNRSIRGIYQTFTAMDDEQVFVEYNCLGVLAYRRAANALRGISHMGVSNPMASYLLADARKSLQDVLDCNQKLSQKLDIARFYFNVRPYFKPYQVGKIEYRGANAGDFAAVNEIDVALGLCRMDDLFYQSILAEKYAFVPPEDQPLLRALSDCTPLLDAFLSEAETNGISPHWMKNAASFLEVCRAHGAAYAFHHQKLVKTFLQQPAQVAPRDELAAITSSGPPLEAVIGSLERLRDLRTARDCNGIGSAHAAMTRLRQMLVVNSAETGN